MSDGEKARALYDAAKLAGMTLAPPDGYQWALLGDNSIGLIDLGPMSDPRYDDIRRVLMVAVVRCAIIDERGLDSYDMMMTQMKGWAKARTETASDGGRHVDHNVTRTR